MAALLIASLYHLSCNGKMKKKKKEGDRMNPDCDVHTQVDQDALLDQQQLQHELLQQQSLLASLDAALYCNDLVEDQLRVLYDEIDKVRLLHWFQFKPWIPLIKHEKIDQLQRRIAIVQLDLMRMKEAFQAIPTNILTNIHLEEAWKLADILYDGVYTMQRSYYHIRQALIASQESIACFQSQLQRNQQKLLKQKETAGQRYERLQAAYYAKL